MTFIERKAYREVPYPLGTEEWKSFLNYAKAYYKEAMQLAADVSGGFYQNEKIYMAILNHVASPLVYLWEKWQLMTSEARLPYATPEYKAQLEENIKTAKETTQKAEEAGFGVRKY